MRPGAERAKQHLNVDEPRLSCDRKRPAPFKRRQKSPTGQELVLVSTAIRVRVPSSVLQRYMKRDLCSECDPRWSRAEAEEAGIGIDHLLLPKSHRHTEAGGSRPHMVTDNMGIRNETFMKIAAVGTWMGDFVTAWMVTDMMLQDTHYPDWGQTARRFWKKGNNRIVLFWSVLISLTSVVVLVISTDWISWDNLNRGFLPSDEVSRAFLASFILVFDLLIVMQDWEFPHFMGDLDMNLPGMSTTHVKVKLPVCKRIFKDEYHIHITGKWFNYGIIFLVLILDLNMWKNQMFYQPYEYGQYVGPGEKIFTVEEPETLVLFNHSTLTYEWRSSNTDPRTNQSYVDRDMFLHSRFVGASLDVKCLAFIPSLAAFVLFGFFVWLFGRFQDCETITENPDKSYERMKRKSPSEYSKDMGTTPDEMLMALSEGMGKSGTPMLLSVDGQRFGKTPSTPSTNSTVSTETQETHPSIVINSAEQDEPAVFFDVRKLSP
uniref:Transmembrane protein 117 n=1 Tax=Knipowitschia caucasica TaxID=637954 RepID=A0AAV2KXK5_KNICA